MNLDRAFDNADERESEIYALDFGPQLQTGEAIESTAWEIEVVDGTDDDAETRLDGSPQIEGTKSCQRITHLVAGVSYRLTATVTTTEDNTLALSTFLTCNG